jgi:ribosomal protein L37AE/L43A
MKSRQKAGNPNTAKQAGGSRVEQKCDECSGELVPRKDFSGILVCNRCGKVAVDLNKTSGTTMAERIKEITLAFEILRNQEKQAVAAKEKAIDQALEGKGIIKDAIKFIRTHESLECDPETGINLEAAYIDSKRWKKLAKICEIVRDFEAFAAEQGINAEDAEVYDEDYDKVWHGDE